MQKKIAFVTSSVKPDFAVDDLHAVESLKLSGAEVHPLPWDDDGVEWTAFDLVVLRSCWNYQAHPEKFRRWIDHLERDQVNLANSGKTAKWNLHKGYLKELCEQGVHTPETIWVAKESTCDLSSLINTRQWSKAVVKPAISANALNTFLFSSSDAGLQQAKFDALLVQGDMLIQKFMPEVQEHGEWSLIFFNKIFSHAVIKRPAPKDFRVQSDFGGTTAQAKPPSFVLQQAQQILELIKEPLLFSRVDGVVSENKFLLMELELIEPVLFLEKGNGSAQTFAKAMAHCIKNWN
ncbi:MAG TPA: hypothetical protein VL728_05175 [Cyclobacteriaceae bacterium]|jgi:hypothetical protein|nr:hypothetical protein [Cyclobacteriaceae bacterium]